MSDTSLLCTTCNARIVPKKTLLAVPSLTTHRLRTGYFPSAVEAADLKASAEAVQIDLDCYDEEVVSLTKALEELKRQRDSVLQYRDKHLGLLAPIRKLPVELLLKIFSLCCTSEEDPGLSVTTDQSEPYATSSIVSTNSLALSQTCGLWRSILLSSPFLWACIRVDLSWKPFDLSALVELYLQRASSSLLTIHIEAFNGVDVTEPDLGFRYCRYLEEESWWLFETLLQTMHRWVQASFDLSLHIYEGVQDFVANWEEPANLENLRVLKLRGYPRTVASNTRGPFESISLFNKFQTANLLSSIQLVRPVPTYLASFEKLSIVEVSRCCTLAEIRNMFSLCPNLKAFRTTEFGIELHRDEKSSEIYSPSLETLALTLRTVHAIQVLPLLNIPHLADLTISGGYQLIGIASLAIANGLEAMLNRSSFLHALALNGNLLSDTGLLQILSVTPSLQQLRLSSDIDRDNLITSTLFDKLSLSLSGDTINLVPCLVSFCVYARPHSQFLAEVHSDTPLPDPQKMISMLESRSGTLKYFTLCAELMSSRTGQWVEAFQANGSEWPKLCALKSSGMQLKLNL
ncbi:hypothetical protein VKT23_001545 [Stygiomarasmius scandens]|uniref:F-box domain-containing protein n=1 Tax=Marasmiellus scandens TaxID=2682957 RepID=A0ABR1K227_9AGAR